VLREERREEIMTEKTFDNAIQSAEEFLRRAKAVPREITNWKGEATPGIPSPSPFVASVKRASLDLTRALAEMRKP